MSFEKLRWERMIDRRLGLPIGCFRVSSILFQVFFKYLWKLPCSCVLCLSVS